MKNAWSLFEGGEAINADLADPGRVRRMRTVCPECLEPVFFVVRETGSYFSHWPAAPLSPSCSLRRESWGVSPSGAPSRRSETALPRLFDKTLFRDLMLSVFNVETIPPPSTAADRHIRRLTDLMIRVWREKKRCLEVADLPAKPRSDTGPWTSAEKLIACFAASFAAPKQPAETADIYIQSLAKPLHQKTALIVWKHLHLGAAAPELRLLLRFAFHLLKTKYDFLQTADKGEINDGDFPDVAASLAIMAISLITRVPWLESARLLQHHRKSFADCPSCNTLYRSDLPNASGPCAVCGKMTCPGCAAPCNTCNLRLCPEHGKNHQTWTCENCRASFCSGAPHPAQQLISPCCQKTYCCDCGRDMRCGECGETGVCYACGVICPGCEELICSSCMEWRHRCDGLHDLLNDD